MTKLKKIDKDIQIKFIIGFLILFALFSAFFWSFLREQRKIVESHHLSYIGRADATIATLLDQAQLNSYITAQEIAELLKAGDKERLLEHLAIVEKREEITGILLNQHILLAVDMGGHVLARSEWIRGERVELEQEGYLRDGWTPSLAFEQAFENALEGEADVRKIIYDRDFLRREGYDFWDAAGMGLTVMTPIIDKETGEQKGVLISITLLNGNAPVVLGLKAVTDVSFTAILPTGEAIGSIFAPESVIRIEEISRSPELLEVARQKAAEIGELIRRGEDVPKEDFILEEFTIERVRLTHADFAGGGTYYYRVVYWLELDSYGNFASLRGISKEIEDHVAQENFLVLLIGSATIFLLIIFGIFYLFIQKRLVHPIISCTTQLKNQKENEKIEIWKNYREFKELEDAFNLSFDQVAEARNVLEIKVKAKTRQLSELSASLEKQVKEKTEDLQKRVDELEMLSRATMGREEKMIELKKEIEKLKEELKKKEK